MDVHETLGRLYQDYQSLRSEYRKLLGLVARIKSGEVSPETVELLPNDAWCIVSKESAAVAVPSDDAHPAVQD
jgi:hypothetical protein